MSYPPTDPYAEPPTQGYQVPGVYQSESYGYAQPTHTEPPSYTAPATYTEPPDPPAPTHADAPELSHQALRRLRARLVRKYH